MHGRSVFALAAAVLVGACSATETVDPKVLAAYLGNKPPETRGLFERVLTEGERNRVLHLVRAGLASMERGYRAVAANAFDEALLTIEAIYGGDERAASARSVFNSEDRKVFRGEPYERAMAFYYRGILYLMEGDYENARASFKSGILQDTLAEQEEYRQDFALLEFLEGWASQCNGDTALARDAYALATEHGPAINLPGEGDNLLVLADVGVGPTKVAEGDHGELLRIMEPSPTYVTQQEDEATSALMMNGEPIRLANRESIVRQAMTRGGREIDTILAGKVQFKDSVQELSNVSASVAQSGLDMWNSGLTNNNQDLAYAGAVVGLAGGLVALIAKAVADQTQPEADTRAWDNLPAAVRYQTYQAGLESGRLPVDAAFERVRGLELRVQTGGDARCRVVWARYPGTYVGGG